MATNIKFAKPAAIETGNGVSSVSAPIIINCEDGAIILGFMQKWICDVNAEHIQAKKGDVLFSSMDNIIIDNPVSWEYAKDEVTV